MAFPSMSLDGRVGVVTGAARGIGRTLAQALASAGARVALLGRDAVPLGTVRDELLAEGREALAVCADVSEVARLDAVFEAVLGRWGRLDILVNNAGIEAPQAAMSVGESLWDRILDTNLKGAFFCAQAAARRMRSGGSILNLCSLTSEVGVAGSAAYGASKSGLLGLTRALATEWAAAGIRVNGIGPGYFRTALTESFYESELWRERMLEKIPLRRFGELADLAGAAVFLSSDAAAYITGQVLYIDGGYLAAL